jgi:hypothetical protein
MSNALGDNSGDGMQRHQGMGTTLECMVAFLDKQIILKPTLQYLTRA